MDAALLTEEVEVVDGEQLDGMAVATPQVILLVGGMPEVDVLAEPSQVVALAAAADVVDMTAEGAHQMVGHYIYKMCIGQVGLSQQRSIVAGYLAESVEVGQV